MGPVVNSTKNLRNTTNPLHSSKKIKEDEVLSNSLWSQQHPDSKTRQNAERSTRKECHRPVSLMNRLVRCCYCYHHCSLFFRWANRIKGVGYVWRGPCGQSPTGTPSAELYLELSRKWICYHGCQPLQHPKHPGERVGIQEEGEHSGQWPPGPRRAVAETLFRRNHHLPHPHPQPW